MQKPHWLAPASTKADDHRSRSSGSSPSRVTTSRPAIRRTGVTHATRARTIHQHSAAATLALGAAPVLDGAATQRLAERVEQRQVIALDLHGPAIEAKGDHGRRYRRPLVGPIS